jgi:DNA-binding IclR family transcriptional regulator
VSADRKQQGVNSIEIGLRLVRALTESGGAMTLKDLAAAAKMPAAKAHRYMVSLIRAGLVEQQLLSGRYDLGPLALTTGLAALGRLDHQRLAWEKLVELREAVGETVAIAVWNGRGAVITRWEDSARPVTVNVRVGSVLSAIFSASGRAIAAFLPRETIEPLVAAEFPLGTPTSMGKPLSEAGYYDLLADIRRRRLARVQGDQSPGISAVSAPVLTHEGKPILSLTVIGSQGAFDVAWTGPNARAVDAAARDLSARLGYTG